MLVRKISQLSLVMLILLSFLPGVRAAVITVDAQALLEQGMAKARQQAVNEALLEALRRNIFDNLAVSRDFEKEIEEKILDRREVFVKSYAIQNERTLGDLYWLELKVEIQDETLAAELAQIQQGRRLKVERLALVVMPPAGNTADLPILFEPSALASSLGHELELYGFSLELLREPEADLLSLIRKTVMLENPSSLPRAEWFQALIDVDLLIVLWAEGVSHESVVSLGKEFWRSQVRLAFIDCRNDLITVLPELKAKVISENYVDGLEKMTRKLQQVVADSCLERLSRDYLLPQAEQRNLRLQCKGLRLPADFERLREKLESLRGIGRFQLQALSAGSLEFEIEVLTPVPLLLDWLADYRDPAAGLWFKVYPLDDNGPDSYLLQAIYEPHAAVSGQ